MSNRCGSMLAILAAGQSRRFGGADKLAARLGDQPLGLHAAATAAALPFDRRLIIASPEHGCAAAWRDLDYRLVINTDATRGLAASVRLAAANAIDCGAASLTILLADMPLVTAAHLRQLLAAFERDGGHRIVASARNGQAMPPTIFPAAAFAMLQRLDGDHGARAMLKDARLIPGDERMLIDIDTREDLLKAERILAESD